MLRMFGLGEGPIHRGSLGWGEVEKEGETSIDVRGPLFYTPESWFTYCFFG